MNKQSALEQIREEAFQDEMEKVAVTTGAVYRALTNRTLRLIKRMTPEARKFISEGLHKSNLAGRKGIYPTVSSTSAAPFVELKKMVNKKLGPFGETFRAQPKMGLEMISQAKKVVPKTGIITNKMLGI